MDRLIYAARELVKKGWMKGALAGRNLDSSGRAREYSNACLCVDCRASIISGAQRKATNYCIMGALWAVATANGVINKLNGTDDGRYAAAVKRIYRVIWNRAPGVPTSVESFNDYPGRTLLDVLDVMGVAMHLDAPEDDPTLIVDLDALIESERKALTNEPEHGSAVVCDSMAAVGDVDGGGGTGWALESSGYVPSQPLQEAWSASQENAEALDSEACLV